MKRVLPLFMIASACAYGDGPLKMRDTSLEKWTGPEIQVSPPDAAQQQLDLGNADLYVDDDLFIDASTGVSWFGAGSASTLPTGFERVVFVDSGGTKSDWSFKVGGSGSGVTNFAVHSGTTASPTVVADTRVLGGLQWLGYDGSAFRSAAQIIGFVNGTPGSNDMPGGIRLRTKPDGSAQAMTTRVTIGADGLVDVDGPVDVSGTTTLNTVTYTWPGTGGSANEVLTNNGSNMLSWEPAAEQNLFETVDGDTGTYTALTPNDVMHFIGAGTVSIDVQTADDGASITITGTGGAGGGDVTGPASSTDNAIARYDGTTGKIIQNSSASVNDSGDVTGRYFIGTKDTGTPGPTFYFTGDTDTGVGSDALGNVLLYTEGAVTLDVSLDNVTANGNLDADIITADEYTKAPDQPGCFVTNSGTQTISHNTNTVVLFDTEQYDNDGGTGTFCHDTSTNTGNFVAPVNGYYTLEYNVVFAANATGVRKVWAQGPSNPRRGYQTQGGISGELIHIGGGAIFKLNANDVVNVIVYQNSGGNLNLGNATASIQNNASLTLLFGY